MLPVVVREVVVVGVEGGRATGHTGAVHQGGDGVGGEWTRDSAVATTGLALGTGHPAELAEVGLGVSKLPLLVVFNFTQCGRLKIRHFLAY